MEPAEGSDGTDGRWRIARKVAPDRVISTVDTEARHTRKSKSERRDGFRGHVAAEPETGLITDCEMTMAAGDGSTDAENGVKIAARDRFRGAPAGDPGSGPAGAQAPDDAAATQDGQVRDDDDVAGSAPGEPGLEVYGDSAYGSGQARADYQAAGHDTVIKPVRSSPRCPAGSPSMTSSWTRSRAPSPARTASPGR